MGQSRLNFEDNTMNPLIIGIIIHTLISTNKSMAKVAKNPYVKNELNGLGEKVSDLEKTISKLNDRDSELEYKVYNKSVKVLKLEETISELAKKDFELEKKLLKKGEKMSELQETISKLAEKDSELEKRVYKLDEKVSNFEKDNSVGIDWDTLDEKKKKFVCFCWQGSYICEAGVSKLKETEACVDGKYKAFS